MYHRRSPLPYEVLYVIAKHRFAVLWQSPGRVTAYPPHARYFCTRGKIGDPAGYFCTRGERRVHKIRICRSIALFNDSALSQIRGPQKILCTFGEKEHTSKRVSIIACDNAISKVQCATRTDTKH